MNYEKLAIPDVVLMTPHVFGDERGFFLETFRHSEFVEHCGDYHHDDGGAVGLVIVLILLSGFGCGIAGCCYGCPGCPAYPSHVENENYHLLKLP